MNFTSLSLMHVTYNNGIKPLPMGRLARKDRTIFFEYTPDFINTGLELSPFKLPLKTGAIPNE